MVEIHPTLYTFLLELVAVLVAIVAWFLVDTIKRRNRDRKVVSIIIDKVKQDAQKRKDSAKVFLDKVYKLEGDELDKASEKLARQETNFFQIFINLYLKRDGKMAASITGLIENLLLPYHQPEQLIGEERIKQLMVVEEVVSSDPEDKDLIEKLNQQNQRLIKENNKLHVEISTTGQTLEQMLEEYSRAFDNSKEEEPASANPVESPEATRVLEKPPEQPALDSQEQVDQEALAAAWESDSGSADENNDETEIDEEALAAAWAAETEAVGEVVEDDASVDEEALAAAWSTQVSLDEDDETQPAVH